MWWRAGHARSTPIATRLRRANRPRLNSRLSGQRHHSAPELRAARGVDVVFAREGKAPTVLVDAIDAQPRAQRLDALAVAYGQRLDACRDEQPSGRMHAERP